MTKVSLRQNIAAFFLFIILAAPTLSYAQPVTDTDANEVLEAPQTAVQVAPEASNSAIADRIAGILNATMWYERIGVDVREGVVFLDGSTSSEARREWARQLALKTTGVVAVVNRIKVVEEVTWSFDPAFAEIKFLANKAVTLLPLIFLTVLVLPLAWYAAWLVSKMSRFAFRNRIESPFLRNVIARIIAFPVFLLGLYVVLQVAGLTQLAISLVGGAGVLGIVIGFAFRDIAENFLSSLILSVRRPFRRGDYIEVGGISGTVRSMNTRSTIVSSDEGNVIHIPNSIIFKNVIENYTSSPERRGEFGVGIGYDATISEAQDVILSGLRAHPSVLSDPAPMVLVDKLGASTVNIKTYFWFDGHKISPIKLKSALLRMVKTELTNAGISMPDEAREVIFPEGVKVLTDTDMTAPNPAPTIADVSNPTVEEPNQTESEGDLLNESDLSRTAVDQLEGDGDDLLGKA